MLENSTSSEVSVEANHARDLQGAILLTNLLWGSMMTSAHHPGVPPNPPSKSVLKDK